MQGCCTTSENITGGKFQSAHRNQFPADPKEISNMQLPHIICHTMTPQLGYDDVLGHMSTGYSASTIALSDEVGI